MFRKQLGVVFVFALAFVLSGAAEAQEIKVRSKAGEGRWCVTTDKLQGYYKTKAEAMQRAREIQSFWSQSENANSDFRPKEILVEGEDDPDASTPSGIDSLKNGIETTAKKVARYSIQNLQNAAMRANEARQGLVGNVERLTKEDFQKANAQINDLRSNYNNMLSEAQSGPDAGVFSQFSSLPPSTMDQETLKGLVEQRIQAKEDEAQLRGEKQELDAEQRRLSDERREVVQEGRAIREEGDRYRLSKQQDADRARSQYADWRRSLPAGTIVEETTIRRELPEDKAEKAAVKAMNERKSSYRIRAGAYRESLAQYNAKLRDHERKVQEQEKAVEALRRRSGGAGAGKARTTQGGRRVLVLP